MSIEIDRKRLLQNSNLAVLTKKFSTEELISVYLSNKGKNCDYTIFPAIIPLKKAKQVLSDQGWDFLEGRGKPGIIVYHEGKQEKPRYYRYGNNDGFEPFVLTRNFRNKKGCFELCEEFRLLHNLYHDIDSNTYLKLFDNHEEIIATIKENEVKVRLKEIQQFLAIKRKYLSIQFDFREHSLHPLEDLNLVGCDREHVETLASWIIGFADYGGAAGEDRAFSRLLGKRLIAPLPFTESGFVGAAPERPKRYVDFIIGTTPERQEVIYTSNPGCLADFFGANPDAPNYLTPVHFNKEVLEKYYQRPSKYKVEDGLLCCGNDWALQIDNHFDDKVIAWIGDLGRDLPYDEQMFWRAYNISPGANKISNIFFKRQLLAQPTDSTNIEHLFQDRYAKLRKVCEEHLSWQILLPLNQDDSYHIDCVRTSLTNEQKEFDEQLLSLTQILIDSLNEKQISQLLPSSSDIVGGINKLEAVFTLKKIEGAEQIDFLRKLQKLRSKSAAHRKSQEYRKTIKDLSYHQMPLKEVYSDLLQQAVAFFCFLIHIIENKQLQ